MIPPAAATEAPVVAFDLETTGTDPATDRIVELAILVPGMPARVFRVNPGIPIPPAATAIHGIGDGDVAGAPPFAAIAAEVQRLLAGATLLGYNSRTFDTPLLDCELRRAGEAGLDLDHVREIDVLRVWADVEPRTLTGAVRRWLDRDHPAAHGAAPDAAAALAVWERMSGILRLTPEDGRRMTRRGDEMDRDGRFVRDAEGHAVFNFGKHRGKRVRSVAGWEDYLRWMMTSDFPGSSKAVASGLLAGGR